ncbi:MULTISPECIES: acyl-CoA dehydrogenase family protein [unclassified Streptomyces]|uniref:acyl-CoA dehydrogenase family protein n=1 Tax=unclassified Streptomyces TaxID=2593676 RepID=UPI0024436AF2|nr:acyl-CoA dehydrogenase family protein [Streptomyces sp. DH41]MDG9724454.1 acyl-CoA dehydrogenase family protein [Streptomyces sp. DH41]
MDFSLGEELEAVRDLAREIFTDRATPERLREVETSPTRVDASLWADLAAAGLLAAVLPEEDGGAGLGMAGVAVLLEEQGRRVAPVPLWPALAGALAVAAHGTARQRAELLPVLAEGNGRVTLALEEFGPADPLAPRTTAVQDGPAESPHDGAHDGALWRLTGTKAVVPAPSGARHVLVTATTAAGPGLFLVASDAPGATWEHAETTSHDLSAHLTLDGVPGAPVGAPGDGTVAALVRDSFVALAAVQVGVAAGALRHAADHLRERQQFGRPLATFQAVQHQLADCYVDIEAMRVTLWQAVDAQTEPFDAKDADRAALVAKWWATEGGLNTVHRVQHVHGGIGVDIDYPVHRHFLWGKQISTTLGGAGADLERLGALLTSGPVAS